MPDTDVPPSRQPLSVHRADEGAVLVLVVQGELDVVTAPDLRREFDALPVATSSRVVVDCRALQFVDSAGLQTFVDAHRRIDESGGTLVLRELHGTPRRIFDITDLGRFLNLE